MTLFGESETRLSNQCMASVTSTVCMRYTRNELSTNEENKGLASFFRTDIMLETMQKRDGIPHRMNSLEESVKIHLFALNDKDAITRKMKADT